MLFLFGPLIILVFNIASSFGESDFLFLVVQDEETGVLYQHKGRDFKVPLLEYHGEDENIVGTKKDLDLWPG